jgi:hypothetical protein
MKRRHKACAFCHKQAVSKTDYCKNHGEGLQTRRRRIPEAPGNEPDQWLSETQIAHLQTKGEAKNHIRGLINGPQL